MNTIGTVRVAASACVMLAPPVTMMTSGLSAANSVACLRMTPASPPPQRESIRTLLPSVHPNCASACTKAAKRPCAAAAFSTPVSAPTSRMRSLRARRERPRRRRTTQNTEKFPPPHVRP